MSSYKEWNGVQDIEGKDYRCGYCGKEVGSDKGYADPLETNAIYICPRCAKPTYFDSSGDQFPGPTYGRKVSGLPNDVEGLFDESRNCIRHSLYNSSVLTSRKILMHVAVDKGADENLSFKSYVQYLADEGYIPPDGQPWVDQIRQKGNEANHEIPSMSREDATQLMRFLEMLLTYIYELPNALQEEEGQTS